MTSEQINKPIIKACKRKSTDFMGQTIYIEDAEAGVMRHFFLRGAHITSQQANAIHHIGGYYKPDGLAFFCKHCSELWFISPVDGRKSMVYTQDCDKHEADWSLDLPGSIWLSWDNFWNQEIPRFLLIRELKLLIKHGWWDFDASLLENI